MHRIGILTPRSTLYPALGFDILNGLNTCFVHLNLDKNITIFTDNIGFGIDEADIYTKAEKMLLSDNVDIVIACCDSRIAAMLQPLFTAANKLLLVTNMGANLPESWQAQPTTIVHSLNFCFNTALTGTLAATKGTAAMTCSYYDAGYNQLFSMIKQFEQKDGIILYNHITHLKADQFTLKPLQEFMASEDSTQNLLCLFSADMAVLFYKEISQIQQSQDCNLFVAPMMLDEALKNDLDKEVLINNIQGYTPWLSTLNNVNNNLFIKIYGETQGKKPNLFHLLGWDAALIIDCFYKQLKMNDNNTAKAVKAISTEPPLPSPRGWIKLDPTSHHIYSPAWLVKATNDFEMIVEENSHFDTDFEWKNFNEKIVLSNTDIHSAWRNTYLCI